MPRLFMPSFHAVVAACALTLAAPSAFAGVTSYDFASVSGQSTPATIGIASFTSPSDPGTFTFGSNGGVFSTLSDTTLADLSTSAHELDIHFSAPQDAISFAFGLVDLLSLNGNDNLYVALDNGTPVSFSSAIPDTDLFPQGFVNLTSATSFTSIEITSANPLNTFSIGNLTTVPEPASMAVLGAGFTALVGVRRRRHD